ncbi:hypothetical protein CR513_08628, partial [Mucuna pruriens]
MDNQLLLVFTLDKYNDEIPCDVVPMEATHILLGQKVALKPFLQERSIENENEEGKENKKSREKKRKLKGFKEKK